MDEHQTVVDIEIPSLAAVEVVETVQMRNSEAGVVATEAVQKSGSEMEVVVADTAQKTDSAKGAVAVEAVQKVDCKMEVEVVDSVN